MDLAGQGRRRLQRADGYAMAALLVGLSVMSVLMSMALPVWSHMTKREKEEELIWRGKQYARAVGLFQRKYANTFPPTVDILVEQRFLRKKYKDPITNDDFQLIPASGGSPTPGIGGNPPGGAGGRGAMPPIVPANQPTAPAGGPTATGVGGNINLGISGVVSKSKESSIKIYNGRQKYNEWAFVYIQMAQAVAAPGTPGGPAGPGGRGGFPGGRGGFPGGQGGRGSFPGAPGQPPPGGGFGPFMPAPPGGRGGMPPLPQGGGFGTINPGGQPPFGVPQAPGQPVPPFGTLPKPPGS